MELSFVLAALKRRFWIVVIFAQLGVLPLVLAGGPVERIYESEARLVVLPSDDQRVSASQPDRYLLTEIGVLSSRSIAEEVAERLGDAEQTGAIRRSTAIEHVTDTDIVTVSVRQDDAERAQLVAQTIVDTYLDRLITADEATRQPELDRLNAEIEVAREALAEINARIQLLYEPILQDLQENGGQIPPETVVAPNEVSERNFVSADIARLELARSNLVNTPSGVNTRIVQAATLPAVAIAESGGVFEIAFLIGLILLGITVTLLWARLSPKLLDELHASEVLGLPVISEIKWSKPLTASPHAALVGLPQDRISSIDQVAVQAEALAQIDQPLTIAVVGAQRHSGTTTVAVALAARFAAAEYSVLLVDADRRDPWITDVFGAEAHGGVSALLGLTETGVDKIFTRTSEPDVRVLGLSGPAGLRRESVPSLIEAAREAANIVIFDAGPLLDAASTVELSNVCDAVVLTVPLKDIRTDDLAVVTRQLAPWRDKVLPVLTHPARGLANRDQVAIVPEGDSLAVGGGLVAVARPAEPAQKRRRSADQRRSADDKRSAAGEARAAGDAQAAGEGPSEAGKGKTAAASKNGGRRKGSTRSSQPKDAPASDGQQRTTTEPATTESKATEPAAGSSSGDGGTPVGASSGRRSSRSKSTTGESTRRSPRTEENT